MNWLHSRWIRITALVVALLALAAVLLVAAFPVGPFKRIAEERLSARFGRPVTIGALERRETFSFNPTIVVRDIRVPQAQWAGSGNLARIAEISTRIRALPLLLGTFSPSTITVRGARIDLVRTADGRKNWAKADEGNTAGGNAPTLDGLDVADTVVRYRDAKRDRAFTVAVVADARGVRLSGNGTVRGAAVQVRAAGLAIGDANRPWPFKATIDGPALAITAKGRMDTPLNTDRMALSVTARANDLKLIDSIIEAGLFGTQPVTIAADVRHDGTRWAATNMKGTIGSSDFAGQITVDKVDGRSRIDGDLRAGRLDFDDLSDDEGLAKARAQEAAIGPRVVPGTRINIVKINKTDGRLGFRIDRIISAGKPTSLRNATGTITLDRQLLKIAGLRVGLNRGAITGTLTVDQRGGRPVPTVTIAADMTGSSIAALTGSGDISGRLDARVRLTGVGSTVRQVVARSDGTIGIVARDGALPAKMAAMLGFDAGRALTTGDDQRATLRCAIVRMAVTNGRGAFAPLLIDTSASQTRGQGAIDFPSEGLSATLTGAPKHDSVLRVPGSVRATGTLSDPQIVVPQETKSVGNILKGLGRAITGKQGPTATDANCDALSRQAIGR